MLEKAQELLVLLVFFTLGSWLGLHLPLRLYGWLERRGLSRLCPFVEVALLLVVCAALYHPDSPWRCATPTRPHP